MSRSNPNLKPLRISFCLVLGLAACATSGAQSEDTPTPEVVIPHTMVLPEGQMISGRMLFGTTPVAGAQVELRTDAWADPNNSETIALTLADGNGQYQLETPPAGGEFGLVALWLSGGANTAPVTPVQVSDAAKLTGMDLHLAKELDLLDPVSGIEQEMVMAVWLIAKGVNPSAVHSLSAKTATNELLSAASICHIG